jgi:hypothetical protein
MPANMPAGVISKGYGVCDPEFRDIRQSAEPWRYATGYLTWTISGGNLTLAASLTQISLFNQGIDEAIGQGFAAAVVNTASDTDLNSEGAPIKEDQSFWAVGMGIDVQRSFTTDNTQVKVYAPWLDVYQGRIQQVVMENFALTYTFGDEACRYQMGTVGMYAPHAGSLNTEQRNRNGAGIGPGQIMPFRAPIAMGARDASDQLTVVLSNGWGLTVSADDIVPVPDAITQVRTPIQVMIYGFPVCKPCGPVCAPGQDPASLLRSMLADPGSRAQLRALLGPG